MSKLFKQVFGLMLALVMLTPLSAFAASPVFNITPSLTSLSLSPSQSATINYSVVNMTHHAINQVSVYPAYITAGNPQSLTLLADTCSGTTMAPGATCTFNILVSGANQPANFVVRPRVCGFNGSLCSIPLGSNGVQVGVSGILVTSVNPSNTSVAVTTGQIVINFNTLINAATVNPSTVSVVQDGTTTNLVSGCSPLADNSSFACTLSSTLVSNKKYDVTISTAVQSTTGLTLASAYTTQFFTSPLIAGDGTTNTYFVNTANQLLISSSAGAFTPVSFNGGPPSGTILLLAGDGHGDMYFTTSTNQIWQNSAGGTFSQATVTGGPASGNIIQLGGSGSTGYMHFATTTNQVWGNTLGGAFTQATFTGGTISGTVSQITGDGVSVTCMLTTANQVFCGFANAMNLVTYPNGSVTGNIIRLTGIVNSSSPIDVSFYTSTNQLWQQTSPGANTFGLITSFTPTQPTGIIQQMASNGSGSILFITTTNQAWDNNNTTTFSPITLDAQILGQANAMAGNGGFIYFSSSSNQLFQKSTGDFAPLNVGFSGNITGFSGSGGYMYFVTLNNQTWANLNGSTFAQISHP